MQRERAQRRAADAEHDQVLDLPAPGLGVGAAGVERGAVVDAVEEAERAGGALGEQRAQALAVPAAGLLERGGRDADRTLRTPWIRQV